MLVVELQLIPDGLRMLARKLKGLLKAFFFILQHFH